MESSKILLADDDASIREVLEYNLLFKGYKVKVVNDGSACLDALKTFLPQLIILDIMMPEMDGIKTCQKIREQYHSHDIVILFLTARDSEYSEVLAFDSGADDFLIKPVKIKAFLKRVEKLLARGTVNQKDTIILTIKDLVIDKRSYETILKDQKIKLPRKEFEILHLLAQSPKRVFSRDDILLKVWGTDVYVSNRTVDVHIRKIREKIGNNLIHTVKGIGYKFDYQ